MMKIKKSLILKNLTIIPFSFILISCSSNQINEPLKTVLVSEFDNYNSTMEIYEGYLPPENWNWEIKTKNDLTKVKTIILENYSIEKMSPQLQLKREKTEDLLTSKEKLGEQWDNIIKKYDDTFFQQNYLIINPNKTFEAPEREFHIVRPKRNSIKSHWFTYDIPYYVDRDDKSQFYVLIHGWRGVEPIKSISKILLSEENDVINIYPEGGEWHSEFLGPNDYNSILSDPDPKVSGVQFTIIPKKYTSKKYKLHEKYSYFEFYDKFVKPKDEN